MDGGRADTGRAHFGPPLPRDWGGRPGRDGPFGPPPGQSPACRFPAPGSHLRSTGQRSACSARGARYAGPEADSGLGSAWSSLLTTARGGFAAEAGDASRVRRASKRSQARVSWWGPRNTGSAHESRSRASRAAEWLARAFVVAFLRAVPTTLLRASSARGGAAIRLPRPARAPVATPHPADTKAERSAPARTSNATRACELLPRGPVSPFLLE
jgi:hypothetical protein